MMKKSPFILLTILVITQCSAQNTTMSALTVIEAKTLKEHLAMDSLYSTQITNSDEPGTELIICGTLLKKGNGNAIANRSIYLYQTDNTGEYRQKTKGDVTSARLHGSVMTNKDGRFTVRTILPGDYPTHPDTKHIHTIIKGAKPKSLDFYFKQYIVDYLKISVENTDNLYLIDLKRNGGALIGFITLKVKSIEKNEKTH